MPVWGFKCRAFKKAEGREMNEKNMPEASPSERYLGFRMRKEKIEEKKLVEEDKDEKEESQ